jgi:hypothetical protein
VPEPINNWFPNRGTAAALASTLRELYKPRPDRDFSQLLLDVDEADWQHEIAQITLRCDAALSCQAHH